MHKEGAKAFWKAFFITLGLMAPILVWTVVAGRMQPQEAASSKSDVPILEPGEDNRLTALVAVADEPQNFVLVRLDAVENTFRMWVIPAQSVVKNGQETLTLADSYAAAGPARAAALLSETLGVSINRYLAVPPDIWNDIFNEAGTARFSFAGTLTAGQLAEAGMGGEVREWSASAASGFLQVVEKSQKPVLGAVPAAAARAAVWQAWARQHLEKLPALLPAALRKNSTVLLTDFSATDLLTQRETLEFLANNSAEPQAQLLPGTWNAAAARYEFGDETLAALSCAQASASASATAGASSGASAP